MWKKIFVVCLAVMLMAGSAMAAGRVKGGITDIPAAGTAVALAAVSTYVYDLTLKAPNANGGFLYIGGPDVDEALRNGHELDATEEWTIREADLLYVYVDTTNGGDDIEFTYRQ